MADGQPGSEHDPCRSTPHFDLEEWYDPATLAAFEAFHPMPGDDDLSEPAMSKVARWSRTTLVGVALRGMALGLREVYDPRNRDEIVVDVDVDQDASDQPVRLLFVPGDPQHSVAFIRPWLFPRP